MGKGKGLVDWNVYVASTESLRDLLSLQLDLQANKLWQICRRTIAGCHRAAREGVSVKNEAHRSAAPSL